MAVGCHVRRVIALLGMNYMDLQNPVYVGDIISAEFDVTEKRDLESRYDAGLVAIDALTTNQDGETVFEGDMMFVFEKRSHYGDE